MKLTQLYITALVACTAGFGDFAPDLPLLVHQLEIRGCREAMPAQAKVIANRAERLQEALRLLG